MPAAPDRGRAATLDDLELHLSTVFPDVRLKKFLELRACDCVPPDLLLALPALALNAARLIVAA